MSPLALQSWSSASKKLVRADKDIRVASITCPMAMMMRMRMVIMVLVIMVLVMRCGEGGQVHPSVADHLSDDHEMR